MRLNAEDAEGRRAPQREALLLQNAPHESTIPFTMAVPDRRIEASESSRTLIIVVAVIAAVAIAGLFYGLMRFAGGGRSAETGLQGAIRAGSPQWDANRPNIVLDEPEATEAKRALGDIVMSLQ